MSLTAFHRHRPFSRPRLLFFIKVLGSQILLAYLLLCILEYSQRRDLMRTLLWPLQAPQIPRLSTASAFLYSWSLVLAFLVFIAGLSRRWATASAVSFFLLTAYAIINYRKAAILNDWLRPSDFANAVGDAPFIMDQTNPRDLMLLVMVLLISAGLWLSLRHRDFVVIRPRSRALLAAVGLFWLAIPCLLYRLPEPIDAVPTGWVKSLPYDPGRWLGTRVATALSYIGIERVPWNENGSLQSNGLLLQFVLSLHPQTVAVPSHYDQKVVCSALTRSPADMAATRPNIILVSVEAFWDPRLLNRVQFSPDPLAAYDRIRARAEQSHLLSPIFGGLSVNTEFEILSGISISRLPFGAVPFQLLDHPVPSLPRMLDKAGYATIAIVPYAASFRNADKAYRYLGFDKHVSIADFTNAEMSRGWISDWALLDKMKAEISHSPRPYFVHAVTMASHGPYDNPFPSSQLTVTGDLSDRSNLLLKTFAQAAQNASAMLEKLVEYIDSQKEPTLLVFFGDHLPALGADLSPYREGGLIPQNWYLGGQSRFIFADDLELQLRMHSTPLVFYKNYGEQKELPPIISAFQVPGFAVREAGLADVFFNDFLGDLAKRFPGIHRRFVVDASGKATDRLDAESTALLKRYDLFIYDRLFGKRFSEGCGSS